MRWTLLLALALLALPMNSGAAILPRPHSDDGDFTLVSGMSKHFTMTVHKQEPLRPVTLDIVFERAGGVVGLHVESKVCSDPNVVAYSVSRTTYVARVSCGYLPVGKYPLTVSLDHGAVQGGFRSTTAHVR
jgi:hypothetical protein